MRSQLFATAELFLRTYRPDWRGCVLTDLQMPSMSGLDLQKALIDREIHLPVIVLTAHGDVQTTRLAMKNGAFDFLEKPVDDEILLDVLQNAIRADGRQHEVHRTGEIARSRIERLTPRERDVLSFVVEGLSLREIAASLGISPRTVEVYKARMMEKLHCVSIADVVRIAMTAAIANVSDG
jgi:RNA polymerase sigma factor (sigma-70 family)